MADDTVNESNRAAPITLSNRFIYSTNVWLAPLNSATEYYLYSHHIKTTILSFPKILLKYADNVIHRTCNAIRHRKYYCGTFRCMTYALHCTIKLALNRCQDDNSAGHEHLIRSNFVYLLIPHHSPSVQMASIVPQYSVFILNSSSFKSFCFIINRS